MINNLKINLNTRHFRYGNALRLSATGDVVTNEMKVMSHSMALVDLEECDKTHFGHL